MRTMRLRPLGVKEAFHAAMGPADGRDVLAVQIAGGKDDEDRGRKRPEMTPMRDEDAAVASAFVLSRNKMRPRLP